MRSFMRCTYVLLEIIWVIKSRMRWTRQAACLGEMHVGFLAQEPEGNRPLGRSRHKWVNIKMYLKRKDWEGVDWINVAEGREN
jgi:hypothetical protein